MHPNLPKTGRGYSILKEVSEVSGAWVAHEKRRNQVIGYTHEGRRDGKF